MFPYIYVPCTHTHTVKVRQLLGGYNVLDTPGLLQEVRELYIYIYMYILYMYTYIYVRELYYIICTL